MRKINVTFLGYEFKLFVSGRRYVYEDPLIGAIISAVAVLDYILGERQYESHLHQTSGPPGDLALAYRNSKILVVEFKAPELVSCGGAKCWRYEIGQVKSKRLNAYLNLAHRGLLYLGLIHALTDPNAAPQNGKPTFRHAPLTTALVIPEDTEKCLKQVQQSSSITIKDFHGYLMQRCKLSNPYTNLTQPFYRRDFVDRYLKCCHIDCCRTWELNTQECGKIWALDVVTLLICLLRCRVGEKAEGVKSILREVAESIGEDLSTLEGPIPYVVTSTLELIPLDAFTDVLGETPG